MESNNNQLAVAGDRGSEWRRWDLHIHTLGTAKNDQFSSDDFDSYCVTLFKAALEHEIAVIGITDYFSIDNYLKVRDFIDDIENNDTFTDEEQQQISEIFVLPNVELRLVPVTETGRLVNLHCIFNPQYSERLQDEFFNELKCSDGGGSPYPMTRQGIIRYGQSLDSTLTSDEEKYEKGVNNLTVTLSDIENIWKQSADFRENCLVVVCNSSKDGASGFRKHYEMFENIDPGSLDGLRKSIYQFSQLIFSGNPRDRNYFLGLRSDSVEEVVSKCGSLKPCIHGSDAHTENDLFIPDDSRCCWIKAEPTFEGLKQIVFEPDMRVVVQELNPQFDFEKPYFSNIMVSGAVMGDEPLPVFAPISIPLNPNMVTIIGGRGTGKSVLLDCLYKLFHSPSLHDDRIQRIAPASFSVEYTKSDSEVAAYTFGEEAKLDYLHVRQGEIKQFSDSPGKLSRAIKGLLGINVTDQTPEYDVEFSTLISRIEKSLAWFEEKDEAGNLVNDKARNERLIASNVQLIGTLTTKENKKNIESYQANSGEINSRNTKNRRLRDFLTKLSAYKVELNRDIAELNKQSLGDQTISDIDFVSVEHEVSDVISQLDEEVATLRNDNALIEQQFRALGIRQDISGLLQKITQYQGEIDSAKGRIATYEAKERSVGSDIASRVQLVDKIKLGLDEQVDAIRSRFSAVKDGDSSWTDEQKSLVNELLSDIQIDANIVFDEDTFYKGLNPIINGQQFRQTGEMSFGQRLRDKFNVTSVEDYFRLIRNERIISNGDDPLTLLTLDEFASQEKFFLKANFNIYQYLYLHTYQKSYLSVQPVIEYLGKPPERLSVGQRGTFYVCMKLATDPFGSPFVFDQPEDDLDNSFIMSELVPLFRKIKKYRQVIIVTHNANLVVNADTEQVIVATNENEILSYQSGAIENTSNTEPLGIRENICDILEGGPAAFRNREKKYGLNRDNRTRM